MNTVDEMFMVWNCEYLRLKQIVDNIIINGIKDEFYIESVIDELKNIPIYECMELMNELIDYYENIKEVNIR